MFYFNKYVDVLIGCKKMFVFDILLNIIIKILYAIFELLNK